MRPRPRARRRGGKQGIAVTSIGIGEEWNEKLLLQLAERSHGNSHWIRIPSPSSTRSGRRSRARICRGNEPQHDGAHEPGVKPVKAYATMPMISDVSTKAVNGQNIMADLGSLDSRRGQAMLIEVRVPPQKAGKFRLGPGRGHL